MSLISDALRKARQDAGRRGGPGPQLPGPLKPPYRHRPSGAVVAMVAILAAVLGAGAVWMLVHGKDEGSRAAPVVETVRTPTVAPADSAGQEAGGEAGNPAPGVPSKERGVEETVGAPPAVQAGTDLGRAENARAAGTPAAPSGPGAGKNGVENRVAPTRDRVPTVPVEDVSGEARVRIAGNDAGRTAGRGKLQTGRTPAPTQSPGVRAGKGKGSNTGGKAQGTKPGGGGGRKEPPASPREISGEGRADGVKLVLDYLVYRATDPFAQINGVEVHVGSEVDGFTVLSIEEDRIHLQGKGGPVILRVH